MLASKHNPTLTRTLYASFPLNLTRQFHPNPTPTTCQTPSMFPPNSQFYCRLRLPSRRLPTTPLYTQPLATSRCLAPCRLCLAQMVWVLIAIQIWSNDASQSRSQRNAPAESGVCGCANRFLSDSYPCVRDMYLEYLSAYKNNPYRAMYIKLAAREAQTRVLSHLLGGQVIERSTSKPTLLSRFLCKEVGNSHVNQSRLYL